LQTDVERHHERVQASRQQPVLGCNAPGYLHASINQERKMSKGQKRSSREQKKPKQNKPKVVASELVTSVSQIKTNPLVRGKQK